MANKPQDVSFEDVTERFQTYEIGNESIREKIAEMRANEAELMKEVNFRGTLTPDEKQLYNKMQFEDTIARMRNNKVEIEANTTNWQTELTFIKSLTPDEKQLYNKMQFEDTIARMQANEAKNKGDFKF